MTEPTWMGRPPTDGELRALERLTERRAEIEAVKADGRDAEVRRLLLATLDDMEEQLCLYGRRAPAVLEGWRRLALFESFGRDDGHGDRGGRDGGAKSPATTDGGNQE